MSTSLPSEEVARARADLYDLLSRIFDGDQSVLVEAMESGAFVEFADVFPEEFDTDALSRQDVDPEGLSVGYDNLFHVPGPYYVPPFASGHVTEPSETFESDSRYHDPGEAGELLGDPAESVAELYEQTNFTPERGEGIPDHVAAEFEFMAVLAAQEAKADQSAAVAENLSELQTAMYEHLEWIDPFADAVGEMDSAEGVYAAVCSFAQSFLAWDRKRLEAATA